MSGRRDITQKVVLLGKGTITQEVHAAARASALVPPFEQTADKEGERPSQASLLETLRVSERRVPLIGRDEIMQRAAEWLSTPCPLDGEADHRVAVIHGPGGAGKTRLAAEILRKAEEDGWTAGFLPGDRPTEPEWPALAHPDRRTAIAIDYAESRHQDLKNIFSRAPVEHDSDGALRLILIVRADKAPTESWLERISGMWELGPRAARLLVDDPFTVSLSESLPEHDDRRDLWNAALQALGIEDGAAPEYLSSPLFERPLYVLLDAYNEFIDSKGADADGDRPPPSAESLADGILRHERQYWTHARSDMELSLDHTQMNEVATTATLLNGVSEDTFGQALRALRWLEDDDNLHRKVLGWWSSVYATDSELIRGVEPDPVGEHLVVRALGGKRSPQDPLGGLLQPQQLRALIAAAGVAGRQRILRVLTRISGEGGSQGASARAALAEILARHLDEFLPETFTGDVESLENENAGEALASTLASAILACNAFQLVEAKPTSGKGDARGRDTDVETAALRIVRRQIERVAAREHDAGRWPADRYAEIAVWSLRYDLEQSDSADGRPLAFSSLRQRELESLDPRPRRGLAGLYLHLGRHFERHQQYDEAEIQYRRALDELDELGEGDSAASYVIWHDLGDIAVAKGEDPKIAIERYERSFEGKLGTAGGPSDIGTAETLLALCVQEARIDFDKGLDRLRDGLADLEEPIGDGDHVTSLDDFPARLFFRVARREEGQRHYEQAEKLYRQALEKLGEVGKADSQLAYVIWHDLGDIAVAKKEDPGIAIGHYEKALDGKARLSELADSSTVTTLIALAMALAEKDVDEALQRLAVAKEELDTERHLSVLYEVSQGQVEILANAKRFDEAAAIAREFQKEQGLARIRSAIFEAVSDPANLKDPFAVGPAAEMSLLAAKIFAVGDMRLTSFTANLAELYAELTGELIISHMDTPTADHLSEQIDLFGAKRLPAEDDPLRLIDESVPNYRDLATEAQTRVVRLIEQSIEEPVISSIHSQSGPDTASLADDTTLRRWLTRAVLTPTTGRGDFDSEAVVLLSFYVGVRLGLLTVPPLDAKAHIEIWQHADSVECARSEISLIAVDSTALDSSIKVEDVKEKLKDKIALALASTGRRAAREGRHAEAESLLRRAQGEQAHIGESGSELTYSIVHTLGEIAMEKSDDPDDAIELFEQALEGRVRLAGIATGDAVTTLLALCQVLARADLELGLERQKRGLLELEESDADDQLIGRIKDLRPFLIFRHARNAEAERQYDEAEVQYRRALDELDELGEGDSAASYVIWHDLGDIAVAKGEDAEVAIERYERSFEGKLGGAVESSDASKAETLLALCVQEGCIDLDRGLQRLEAGIEELEETGFDQSLVGGLKILPARLYFGVARWTEEEERYEDAKDLYERAHAGLTEVGEDESQLAYVIWHDLGDIAVATGEKQEVAIEHYERSLEGKKRVSGAPAADTVTTLLALCQALASKDPKLGRERATQGMEELRRLGADETQIARLKALLSTITPA